MNQLCLENFLIVAVAANFFESAPRCRIEFSFWFVRAILHFQAYFEVVFLIIH